MKKLLLVIVAVSGFARAETIVREDVPREMVEKFLGISSARYSVLGIKKLSILFERKKSGVVVQSYLLDGKPLTGEHKFIDLVFTEFAGLEKAKKTRLNMVLSEPDKGSVGFELKFTAGVNWTSYGRGDPLDGGVLFICGKAVLTSLKNNDFDAAKTWDNLDEGVSLRLIVK